MGHWTRSDDELLFFHLFSIEFLFIFFCFACFLIILFFLTYWKLLVVAIDTCCLSFSSIQHSSDNFVLLKSHLIYNFYFSTFFKRINQPIRNWSEKNSQLNRVFRVREWNNAWIKIDISFYLLHNTKPNIFNTQYTHIQCVHFKRNTNCNSHLRS